MVDPGFRGLDLRLNVDPQIVTNIVPEGFFIFILKYTPKPHSKS